MWALGIIVTYARIYHAQYLGLGRLQYKYEAIMVCDCWQKNEQDMQVR